VDAKPQEEDEWTQMEKPEETNQQISVPESKPIELNEEALLMGFMAGFGRKDPVFYKEVIMKEPEQ
jgi:hypothetical protein